MVKGWRLARGLALSVAALLAFGKIAESIREQDRMAALDRRIPELLHAWVTPGGTKVLRAVSAAGSPPTLAIIGLAVAVALFVARYRVLALCWVAALVGAGLLDWLLKLLFHRTRPETAWAFLYGHSWSFPSGHVMGSVATYGMLAYLAVRRVRAPLPRVLIITGAAVLIVAIGLSRLYLGVHYFSDVAGGLAAGTVWLAACITAIEEVRRRRDAWGRP